ncbi:hypothetical protein MMC10_007100 [Thelotrema lepadinum]|nr:hypothetical protein [Thelotrema lepadinum]
MATKLSDYLDINAMAQRLPLELFQMICEFSLRASHPIILHTPLGMFKKKLKYKYEFDEHAFDGPHEKPKFEAALSNLLYSETLDGRYRDVAERVLLRVNTIKVVSRAASRDLVDSVGRLAEGQSWPIPACVLVEVPYSLPAGLQKVGLTMTPDPIEDGDSDYDCEFVAKDYNKFTGDARVEPHHLAVHDFGRYFAYLSSRRALTMVNEITDLERLNKLHVIMHYEALDADYRAMMETYEQKTGWHLVDAINIAQYSIHETCTPESKLPLPPGPSLYNSVNYGWNTLFEVNHTTCCVAPGKNLWKEVGLFGDTDGYIYPGIARGDNTLASDPRAYWWRHSASQTYRNDSANTYSTLHPRFRLWTHLWD